MNYTDAKNFIENKDIQKSVFGLETTAELLNRLGSPQDKIKVVHVAGTNGKGSVIAFLNKILICARLKTGTYTSPALTDFRENIKINNKKISKKDFAKLIELISSEVSKMIKDGFCHPTRFEIETALAYLYFFKNNCDISLIETGMGGKLDATNAVKKPVMEIITSVDFDHIQYLGNTLEKIASHKAGIIKPGTTVVSINQNSKVNNEIENACKLNNCELIYADAARISNLKYSLKKTTFDYKTICGNQIKARIELLGAYQPANAIIAIEAAEVLKKHFKISDTQICSGLKGAKWFGRFTVLSRKPLFILDGAHNAAAAKQLAKSLDIYLKGKNIIFIFGVFSDKDYKGILRETAHYAKKIIIIDAPSDRALEQSKILEEIKKYNKCAFPSKNIEDAIKQSLENTNENDAIVAFGSLSFLQDIKNKFRST